MIGDVKVDNLDTSRVEDMVKDIFSNADQVRGFIYNVNKASSGKSSLYNHVTLWINTTNLFIHVHLASLYRTGSLNC